MKHVLLALAGCILLSAARAAVPVEWTADIDNPAARPVAVGLGETVRLVARLQRHGAPYDPGIATAALYLQTNGMGRTWLTAPATVASNELSAIYTPATMGGAPVVSAFLGGRDADGGVYRAFALLRTYHAPGALPGAMPPEAPADLDFAAFTVTNAPWATPEAVDAAIADALADYEPGGGVAEETDPVFGFWATTNTLYGDIAELNTAVENDYQLILAASNSAANAAVKANVASNTAARALAAADGALAAATNYTDAAIASIPPPDLSAYQRHASAALGANSFAVASSGAWGNGATATATGSYQIGEGVNSAANTLQFREHRLLDASGTIPDERLPDAVRRGARFADASYVLWRELAERVEALEDAQ